LCKRRAHNPALADRGRRIWEVRGHGQPLLTTNLFWFDGAVIEGGACRACFTVAEHGRILPAATPIDFSTEYASVVVYGTIRVVAAPE